MAECKSNNSLQMSPFFFVFFCSRLRSLFLLIFCPNDPIFSTFFVCFKAKSFNVLVNMVQLWGNLHLLYKAQCVCLFAIQIHSYQSISTKLGMKHPWGQGQSKVWLLMHLVEARSAESSRKTRKCLYLGNHWTDFNQNWCVDARVPCASIIF